MRAPFAILTTLGALIGAPSVWASPVAHSSALDISPRSVKPGPKHPSHGYPQHPQRRRICPVKTHGDGLTDDASYILSAIRSCNNGGRVLFKQDATYTVGSAMDLTFLRSIDLDIRGTITFTSDTDYWQANSFRFGFQNVTSFFKLGGSDVNIYGGGTLDGNGQKWYDLYAQDIYTLRPVLIGVDGLHQSSIQNLDLRYSPQYYIFIANSTDVVFDSLDISGASSTKNPAKNTDGLDSYRTKGLTFQNSKIVNGDDCYSAKPNSTDVLIQNLSCDGSHGISIGSLGQYKGETDIVEDVYVYNISMSNASDGARIKVWPGVASALSGDLQGGGGTGRVRNVTYERMTIANVDYGIEITQCYGQKNQTLCNEFPSSLTISDILFKDITGTSSGRYEPFVGHIVCSSPATCANIRAVNIDVVSPKGSKLHTCQAVDDSLLQLQCTDANSPAN